MIDIEKIKNFKGRGQKEGEAQPKINLRPTKWQLQLSYGQPCV